MTKEGFKKLEQELLERKEKTRKKIAKKLSAAAEFGDRSENASYTAAMEERDTNESRIAELEAILSDVLIVREDKGNKDSVVSVGDKVELSIDGKSKEYEIVGASEGDTEKGKLSAGSPIGMAVMGRSAGETAKVETPLGKMKVKVVKVK